MRRLVWLIPLALAALAAHQGRVLTALIGTYTDGGDVMAQVEDFDIKHISSQTNGYVVLRFTPEGEPEQVRKLSLPVQIAAKIQDSAIIPIKYRAGSSQPVVMVPTYPFHRNIVLVNLAILVVSVFTTAVLARIFTK